MAVRIRLKRLGRRHRPFFRVCAMDARTPRDGRVIEELGYYDPMVKDVDARAVLKGDRIDYWLSVGAQPTPKVKVLIKKYGSNGTHLEKQREALERVKQKPSAPPPKVLVPVDSASAESEEGVSSESSVEPSDEGTVEAGAEVQAGTSTPDDATDAAPGEASSEAVSEGDPQTDEGAQAEEAKEAESAE